MSKASLTCRYALAWLPDYVTGRLGLTELALIETHLAQCASCRQTSQALGAGADRSPPRIRHRRWRPGRLIVPAASNVTRAIARIVASRPRSTDSRPAEIASLPSETPSRQGASSWLRLMAPLRHTASSLRRFVPSVPSAPVESLVRIGTVLVALALVGGVWWLPTRDGSRAPVPIAPTPAKAPAPPAPPMVTTAEPVTAPEVARPAPVVPPHPRSSRSAQSAERRRAPSPSPAPESVVPPPEWTLPGGARSDSPRAMRAPTPRDQVQPAPSAPDPAAVVDWLLRGDGRGAASRGRAETP